MMLYKSHFLLFYFLLQMVLTSSTWAGIRHERVIWTEDPGREAGVAWSSDEGGPSLMYYDTVSRQGEIEQYRFSQASAWDGVHDGAKKISRWFHHVRLKKLEPDTVYWFVVKTGDVRSEELSFRTAKDSSGFKLILGGDSRSDSRMRQLMNQAMSRTVREQDDVLALVFGGDFVDDGADFGEWLEWLDDFRLTRVGSRILPIVPIRGNHEGMDELFNQIWDSPGGPDNYFVSRFGPLALFNLNTNISHFGDQRTWLKAQLDIQQNKARWMVANYHRPAYPAVKKPGQAREAWVPLFEDYQLDLVFESDGHVYKQTAPIYREDINTERGIIYVGEGGLGVSLREPVPQWYLSEGGFSARRYHFQLLEVTEDAIQYSAIDEKNRVFGQLNLKARQRMRS